MYFQGDEDGGPLEGIDRRGFHASAARKGEDFDDDAKVKSSEIAVKHGGNEGDEVGKDKDRGGLITSTPLCSSMLSDDYFSFY